MPYKCTACNKTFRYKVSQKSHKCPINNLDQTNQCKKEQIINNTSDNTNCTESKITDIEDVSSTAVLNPDPNKTSIVVSCDPLIEISYNSADIPRITNTINDEVAKTEELVAYVKTGSELKFLINYIFIIFSR